MKPFRVSLHCGAWIPCFWRPCDEGVWWLPTGASGEILVRFVGIVCCQALDAPEDLEAVPDRTAEGAVSGSTFVGVDPGDVEGGRAGGAGADGGVDEAQARGVSPRAGAMDADKCIGAGAGRGGHDASARELVGRRARDAEREVATLVPLSPAEKLRVRRHPERDYRDF